MNDKFYKAEFTKKMKKTHTILLPDMLHYINDLLIAAFEFSGYKLKVLPELNNQPEYALKYISGDYCLPAMLILGQMLGVVEEGIYPKDSIAFMEPQTGGACRAGNYYNSIIHALKKAGYDNIPVISLNAFGEEKHEGFTITPKLLFSAIAAVCYGDLLMTLYQQTRGMEAKEGDAKACHSKWIAILSNDIKHGKNISKSARKKRYKEIIDDFSKIEIKENKKTKVGIVGEIYIKFSPIGNSHLEDFLVEQNCDYRMIGFINYIIYIVDSEMNNHKLRGKSKVLLKGYEFVLKYLKSTQKDINQVLNDTDRYTSDADFDTIKGLAMPILNENCNCGDGWLVCAEIADLAKKGYTNILVLHPFGCLVSHVCERGIINSIHKHYKDLNIQTIEYDYDSSKTLRESRIMLGLYRKP
ncbi:MAG: 2-hydroxyacyl-CoA dehydratase [Lachnospiraceae bacterium]|nr:2-hydroxyacyl-CoA dehydratase [Lachnospiraceae bacterium]